MAERVKQGTKPFPKYAGDTEFLENLKYTWERANAGGYDNRIDWQDGFRIDEASADYYLDDSCASLPVMAVMSDQAACVYTLDPDDAAWKDRNLGFDEAYLLEKRVPEILHGVAVLQRSGLLEKVVGNYNEKLLGKTLDREDHAADWTIGVLPFSAVESLDALMTKLDIDTMKKFDVYVQDEALRREIAMNNGFIAYGDVNIYQLVQEELAKPYSFTINNLCDTLDALSDERMLGCLENHVLKRQHGEQWIYEHGVGDYNGLYDIQAEWLGLGDGMLIKPWLDEVREHKDAGDQVGVLRMLSHEMTYMAYVGEFCDLEGLDDKAYEMGWKLYNGHTSFREGAHMYAHLLAGVMDGYLEKAGVSESVVESNRRAYVFGEAGFDMTMDEMEDDMLKDPSRWLGITNRLKEVVIMDDYGMVQPGLEILSRQNEGSEKDVPAYVSNEELEAKFADIAGAAEAGMDDDIPFVWD